MHRSLIPVRYRAIMMHIMSNAWGGRVRSFVGSIWFFPLIATLVLVALTTLQLSGTSIGIYHTFFYGNQADPDLIFNHPESIRSDEWVVSSQKAIAQKNNNFAPVNQNFGDGEDAALLGEMPYAEWSILFKPQSLGFFVLPFDNAFALRWWIMAYFLILACYFFVLTLMPGRKRLAILLSLAFALSPFFQWWYVPSALATSYLSLFGMTVFVKLLHSKRRLAAGLWGILLAYIATCFILILYPPFMIPCGFVIAFFAVGYMLNHRKKIPFGLLRRNVLLAVAAAFVAASLAGLFIYQKRDVVAALQNSVYPGHRVVESGGFSPKHFFSSDLSPIFQSKSRADTYLRPGATNAINQSESSNFILIFPFLLIPLYYCVYKKYKRTKQIDYILVSMSLALLLFMAWVFVPGLGILGKLTLLDKVPLSRMIIGFGLLNLMFTLLFVKLYDEQKHLIRLRIVVPYALVILACYLLLNFNVVSEFPAFLGYKSAIVLAFVIPIITSLMVRKMYVLALLTLIVFSVGSVYKINPLYEGTEVLTDTKLSKAIRSTEPSSKKRWISEDISLENFAAMNGRPSLTGVYVYPQLSLWDELNQPSQRGTYNRYAHVNFTFTRTRDPIKPRLLSPNADQFNVKISPCDPFFKENNVGFLITSVRFEPGINSCTHLSQVVSYPQVSYFIYKVTF